MRSSYDSKCICFKRVDEMAKVDVEETMSENDVSDLISVLRDIETTLRPLIKKQMAIDERIEEKIREVRRHHSDCNIARSFGAGASTAGGSLMAASADFQGRDGSTAGDIGLAVTAVGKFISLVTDIADEVRSKSFIVEVREIVATQNYLSGKLREKLDKFQLFLAQSSRSRKLLSDVGFNPEVSFSQHQSQLLTADSSGMRGDMTSAIDYDFIVNNSIKKIDEMKRAVDVRANLGATRHHARPQLRSITAGSHSMSLSTNQVKLSTALPPTIASTLLDIGAVDDIGAAIEGWTKKHRIEEAMTESSKRLKKSMATLMNFLEDIEKSVQLLEKKLMQMRATRIRKLQPWPAAVRLFDACSITIYFLWIYLVLVVTSPFRKKESLRKL